MRCALTRSGPTQTSKGASRASFVDLFPQTCRSLFPRRSGVSSGSQMYLAIGFPLAKLNLHRSSVLPRKTALPQGHRVSLPPSPLAPRLTKSPICILLRVENCDRLSFVPCAMHVRLRCNSPLAFPVCLFLIGFFLDALLCYVRTALERQHTCVSGGLLAAASGALAVI